MQDALALLYKKVSRPGELVRKRTGDLTGDGRREVFCLLIKPHMRGPQFKFLHFCYTHGDLGCADSPHYRALRDRSAYHEAAIRQERRRALGSLD